MDMHPGERIYQSLEGSEFHQENVALRGEVDKASRFEEIVGASPTLAAVLSRVS